MKDSNWKKANELFRAGNYDEAIRKYDEVSDEYPRLHWPRLNAVDACIRTEQFEEAFLRLNDLEHSSSIGESLIEAMQAHLGNRFHKKARLTSKLLLPTDYNRRDVVHDLLPVFKKLNVSRPFPSGFPFEMALPKLVGNKNDFSFIVDTARQKALSGAFVPSKIAVIASVTGAPELTALRRRLANQSYSDDFIELFYHSDEAMPTMREQSRVRQLPKGFWTLPSSEQEAYLGKETEILLFLEGDVVLDSTALERVARYFSVYSKLIVPLDLAEDTQGADSASLSLFAEDGIHKKWIGERFPFRRVSGQNFFVAKNHYVELGGFDGRFESTKPAAIEFCYRAYNTGFYFLPNAVARFVSQAEQDSKNDKDLFIRLCPCPWDRKHDDVYEVPKVSIYIPAYNASRFIVAAVNSVLSQDFQDLEVCIADDGSSDQTLEVLEKAFGNEPRVRWESGRNGGIGFASNRAVRMSRGMYIGQLDSDDCLKPGAIKRLVQYLDEHAAIGCVYSSCERIDADGNFVQQEYSYPQFSREKMLLTSIAHHFRMFRRQVWQRTTGFREDIINAIDYDMFLKLSEVSHLHHIDEVLYQRRWHGANTSNVNEGHQTTNTYRVQRKALERMGLRAFWDVHVPNAENPRKVTYKRNTGLRRVFFWPDYSHANPYQRLLYGQSSNEVDYISADIDAALKAVGDAEDPENIYFHLHWLNKLFASCETIADAKAAAGDFIQKLKKFAWRGGKVVWTIHNLVSHDGRWPEIEVELSRQIVDVAFKVHLHYSSALKEVENYYPIPIDKVIVSRHGNYFGAYPDYVSRKEARGLLGLDKDDDVILFLGQIRAYKGVEALVEAFVRLASERDNTVLLIAGKANYDIGHEIERRAGIELRKRIRLHNRFIDDAELQVFFRAADFAAFPYEKILTSGSLFLSLTYGIPVVMPSFAMVDEVLSDSLAGIRYASSEGVDGLRGALEKALDRKLRGQGAAMRTAAKALAEKQTWPMLNYHLGGMRSSTLSD